MSAIDKVPTNMNPLSPIGHRFQIKKIPHVNFFLQEVAIPGMNFPHVEQANPLVRIPIPGDHMEYDDLYISFQVDENLQNYQELFLWIRDVAFDKNTEQYKNILNQPRWSGNGIYSDVSVLITTSHANPHKEFTFRDAFPVALSKLSFSSTADNIQYLTCQAAFKYTVFDLETL